MELEYPDQFEPIQSNGPLAKWKGTIAELLEYLIPLQIAGKLLKLSGEPMAYSDTIKLVESIYGITITAPYTYLLFGPESSAKEPLPGCWFFAGWSRSLGSEHIVVIYLQIVI